MKVLLVTTPITAQGFDRSSVILQEPLALEYIGAGVQADHDVKLVDLRIDTEPTLKEILETFQPDIIGCGAYTPEVNVAKQILAEAKKILPGILTVIGGVHATVVPEDFFEDYIDIVVIGEGVFPFKKICQYHEKQKSFEDIDNICFRNNGKVVFTKKQPMPPLDDLPLPARTLTSHIRHRYGNFAYKPLSIALMRSSVGCYFKCKFCAVSSMLDRKMYFHGIDRIIEDLASVKEPIIFWTDDELLLETKHAVLLAQEIYKSGIKKEHAFFGRSDSIVNHPECIESWAKSGLYQVWVGFESHKDDDLKKMKKATNTSKNQECIRICHENNVQVRGNFILMPEYDKKDFRNLAKYVINLGLDFATYCVWTPLPGTESWEDQKNDLIIRDYNFFDMLHVVLPTKLPLKKFYKEFSDLMFKRSYPLKKRIELFKQVEPKLRRTVISYKKKMYSQLRDSYKFYDKSLW